MTLIPEIHDVLSRAIAARRATRRRAWRVSLLALGGVIFAGSALAATNGWHPTLGTDLIGHAREARSTVPADQVAALSVLRRPQTDADRGADVRAILRFLGPGEINGIHTDGIRLLRRNADGGVTILVPTERVGRHDKGYASSIQRHVLCVMTSMNRTARTFTVTDSHGRRRVGHTPGGLAAGVNCGSLRDLKTNGIGAGTRSGSDWLANRLVPDGVAKVVVRLRRHRRITVDVHHNLYSANTGTELPPGWGMRWLDARGQPIAHRRADVPG